MKPVYAVVGPSRFLRHEAVAQILKGADDTEGATGHARFDGSRADVAAVLDEVRTESLLSEHRVAIVDDADPFITANRPLLERYCARPNETGSLILLCKSMPKTTRLYKAIRDAGTVVVLDVPRGRGLVTWTVKRAQSPYGKRLSPGGAQRLVEHLGDGLDAIDAELGKLAAFSGSHGEITPADIDELTGHHREEKIFAVIDALSVGDTSGALRHWEQVLATDRAAPARAIAGLAWGVRRLHDARCAWERGESIASLARGMFTDPATLRRRFDRFSRAQLEGQQRDLLAADIAVKTGAATVHLTVERFIVKHATAGLAGRETG